jgi:hypothetical protein
MEEIYILPMGLIKVSSIHGIAESIDEIGSEFVTL